MDSRNNIEIYLAVKNREITKFPRYFWDGEDGALALKEIVDYMIRVELGYSDDDIRNKLSVKEFRENRLTAPLNLLHGVFPCIDFVYPGKFKFWEMRKAPANAWTLQTAKEATIWLLEDKLKMNKEDMKQHLTKETFVNNGLSKILYVEGINGSPYRLIENAYGKDFIRPWELKMTPMNFWNNETVADAVHWLVDTGIFSKEELLSLTGSVLSEYGMYSAYTYFNESLIALLQNAYPGEYIKIASNIYYLETMTARNRQYKNNTSDCAGVVYNKSRDKWRVSIQVNNQIYNIGEFNSKEEAITQRKNIELELLYKNIVG